MQPPLAVMAAEPFDPSNFGRTAVHLHALCQTATETQWNTQMPRADRWSTGTAWCHAARDKLHFLPQQLSPRLVPILRLNDLKVQLMALD